MNKEEIERLKADLETEKKALEAKKLANESSIESLPEVISDYVEKTLKEHYFKNLVMGQEVFCRTILNLIEQGKDIEYIREFCKKTLSRKTEKAFDRLFKKQDE